MNRERNAPAAARPHVVLSAAVSLDGHLDDLHPDRLMLSGPEDLARVDALRARSDAILIGATTLLRDRPGLALRDPGLIRGRRESGLPDHPRKVVLTNRTELDRDLGFWHNGGTRTVYTTDRSASALAAHLRGLADVVPAGQPVDLRAVLADLADRGVQMLMVEGGGSVLTQFLAQGLADELHLAVAPHLVGESDAPRFLRPAAFPGGPRHRFRTIGTELVGDVVVARYAFGEPTG
ncbi:RibD family protein [Kitasatospora sp. NPDC088783]|uniref:RibD family protein n=1 Tax=Kitasatospora sp. NPDC088783 TaxID=3364077 RepID=UPI00382FB56C